MKPHLVIPTAALAAVVISGAIGSATQRGIDRIAAGAVPATVRAPIVIEPPSGPPPPGPGPGQALPLPMAADKPRSFTLAAVGDIMLSRVVGQKMRERGPDYPFAAMRDWLCGADIGFGNLETSIAAGRVVRTGEMVFRADPGSEKAMDRACIDVVSLANNHAPNFGGRALLETFGYLRGAGIAYAGAGEDAAAAAAPAFLEANGLRVAFLAYNDADVVPASYAAAEKRPGTAFMDKSAMAAAVAAARDDADLVIVSMHSGTEYVANPNARQVAFARAAVDAGADMVIGHHPHVVQTAEKYKGKWIFYSLGNFIFDQMWSRQTREGLGLKVFFQENAVLRIELMPVLIADYAQPAPYGGPAADKLVARLGVPVEKVGGNGYVLAEP